MLREKSFDCAEFTEQQRLAWQRARQPARRQSFIDALLPHRGTAAIAH